MSATIQPATPSEFKKALHEIKNQVHKAFEGLMNVMIDDVHIPNIGDNDSGYCIRITPNGSWVDATEAPKTYINLNPRYELPDVETMYPSKKADEHYEWIADTLDCRPTLGLVCAALQKQLPELLFRNGAIEFQILSSLIQTEPVSLNSALLPIPFSEAYPRMHSFPAFGLWTMKHERYTAIMRAGSTGQKGKGGHAHNDQLSFVLSVNGEEFLGDPGTFWYTASPLMRNIGRSVTMHSTLIIPGKEQNTWMEGPGDLLFWMKPDQAKADGMFNETVWRGIHHAYGEPHMRNMICSPLGIKGHDSCKVELRKIVQFHCVPGIQASQIKAGTVQLISPLGTTITLNSLSGFAWEILPAVYSRAYGRVEESMIIRMEVDAKTHDIHWEIKI